MTLQQIQYFCAVCETLHYTKAAEKMHVTQPCLSYAIGELEKELGVALFNKKGKQIVMTDYGKILYPHAQQILHMLKESVEAIENKKHGMVKRINLGYLRSLSFDFLPLTIDLYYQHIGSHDVMIDFISCRMSEVFSRITSGEVDIAFVAGPFTEFPESPLVVVPCFKQELFLLTPKSHYLANRQEVTFEEIKDENYIGINPSMGMRIQMDAYFAAKNVQPRILFALDDSDSMISCVNAGMGVAFAPRLPSLDLEKVSVLRISDYPLMRDVCLIYDSSATYSPTVRNFIDFIIKASPLPLQL